MTFSNVCMEDPDSKQADCGQLIRPTDQPRSQSASLQPGDLRGHVFSNFSLQNDQCDYENDQAWYIAAKRLEKFRSNSISSSTKAIIQPDTIVDSKNKANWENLQKSVPKTIGTLGHRSI